MNDTGILVRPPRPTGPILLLLFGLFWFAISLFAAVACVGAKEPEFLYFWIPTALASLLICLGSAGWWIWELSRRRWLEITPDGFTIRHGNALTHVAEEQVLGSSSTWKPFYVNGALWSTTRTVNVWIIKGAKEHEMLTLVCKIAPGADDPLAALMEQINGKLTMQAKNEFKSGQVIYGEGWTLDHQTLRITPKRKIAIEIALASIEAVDVIDEELCFWIEGRDEAIAKVPTDTANACILRALIADLISGKRPAAPEPKDGRLGRMIFQREYSFWALGGHFFIVLFFIALSTQLTITRGLTSDTQICILVSIFVSLLAVAEGSNHVPGFFRCHLFGVHKKTLFSEIKLHYSDLTSLTYIESRAVKYGVIPGTRYDFTFESFKQEKSRKLKCEIFSQIESSVAESLRDHISMAIALKMVKEVNEGQKVPWTNEIFLLSEGVEYPSVNFLAQKQAVLLPYDEISRYEFHQGTYLLFSHEGQSPSFKAITAARNFFPGAMALELLRRKVIKDR